MEKRRKEKKKDARDGKGGAGEGKERRGCEARDVVYADAGYVSRAHLAAPTR